MAHFTGKPDQPRFTIIGSGSWSARANGAAALMRPSIARANEQLDPRQQLANTPPPQSATPRPSSRKHLPDGATRAKRVRLHCWNAGSDNWEHKKGVRLLKRRNKSAAMVLGQTMETLNPYRPTDLYDRRWLWILKKSFTIIERQA